MFFSEIVHMSFFAFFFNMERLKLCDGLVYGQESTSFASQNWMSPLCFANTETGRTGITLTLGLAALFPRVL